jgi:hypothetical protein
MKHDTGPCVALIKKADVLSAIASARSANLSTSKFFTELALAACHENIHGEAGPASS